MSTHVHLTTVYNGQFFLCVIYNTTDPVYKLTKKTFTNDELINYTQQCDYSNFQIVRNKIKPDNNVKCLTVPDNILASIYIKPEIPNVYEVIMELAKNTFDLTDNLWNMEYQNGYTFKLDIDYTFKSQLHVWSLCDIEIPDECVISKRKLQDNTIEWIVDLSVLSLDPYLSRRNQFCVQSIIDEDMLLKRKLEKLIEILETGFISDKDNSVALLKTYKLELLATKLRINSVGGVI